MGGSTHLSRRAESACPAGKCADTQRGRAALMGRRGRRPLRTVFAALYGGTMWVSPPTKSQGYVHTGRTESSAPTRRNRNRAKRDGQRPPDTRKHTVLPVSIRLKSTEKTPACVSMRAFLQPISARIYFGKTASHRKRARFVQSRGASPQAYWMSVKAAQRWGCAKRAFCGVCFLMPGGLSRPVRIHCTALFFRRSS